MSKNNTLNEMTERLQLQQSILVKTNHHLKRIMTIVDDIMTNGDPTKESMVEIVLAANSANSNVNCLIDYVTANLNTISVKSNMLDNTIDSIPQSFKPAVEPSKALKTDAKVTDTAEIVPLADKDAALVEPVITTFLNFKDSKATATENVSSIVNKIKLIPSDSDKIITCSGLSNLMAPTDAGGDMHDRDEARKVQQRKIDRDALNAARSVVYERNKIIPRPLQDQGTLDAPMPQMHIVSQTLVPNKELKIMDKSETIEVVKAAIDKPVVADVLPKATPEFTPLFNAIDGVIPMGICDRLMTPSRSPLNGIFAQSPVTPSGRGRAVFGMAPWAWHTKKNLEDMAPEAWLYLHQGFYGTGDVPTRLVLRGTRFMVVWDLKYEEDSVLVWAVGLSEENKHNGRDGWFAPRHLSATYLYNMVKEIDDIAANVVVE